MSINNRLINTGGGGAEPWQVTNAALDYSFTYGTEGGGVFWKPDGTKFWVTQTGGTENTTEYSVSTPWDLRTRSSLGSIKFNSPRLLPMQLCFSADGSKFVFVHMFGNIRQYNASTNWSILIGDNPTASQINTAIDSTQVRNGNIFWNSSGNRLYRGYNALSGEYFTGSGFNISSLSSTATGVSLAAEPAPGSSRRGGLAYSPDGLLAITATWSKGYALRSYSLSTPFDNSTATLIGTWFNTRSAGTLNGFAVSTDGLYAYMKYYGGIVDQIKLG